MLCVLGSGGQRAAAAARYHDAVGHTAPKGQIASLNRDNHGPTGARDDTDLFTWDEPHILQALPHMRATGESSDVDHFTTFALR